MARIFWWRLLFGLAVILLQFSLGTIVFPGNPVPGLLLNTIVALVLVRGFREGASQWLVLLIGYDLLRVGFVTPLVPMGILLAYATSFISRRYVFEHRGVGMILLSFLSVAFGILYVFFLAWTNSRFFGAGVFLSDSLLAFIFFFPVFSLVQYFESRLETVYRSDFRGMRHSL
ncbi:MAG: hypothetical protein ABI747_03925 [Candidatus Moraniibacteriota bacterium]